MTKIDARGIFAQRIAIIARMRNWRKAERRMTMPIKEWINRADLLEAVEKVIRRGGGVLDIYDLIKWYGKE